MATFALFSTLIALTGKPNASRMAPSRRALALTAVGDDNAAVDALVQALMLAGPQGYVRVFADEGPPMAALLARLVAAQKADLAAARGVELGCLARVLRAFGETPPRRVPDRPPPRRCRAWSSS